MGKLRDERQPINRDDYIQNDGATKTFWRETLWYRDDVASERTATDIEGFREQFEQAPSSEMKFFAFQQELMTETMALVPAQEKARQDFVDDIHTIITAPTKDSDLSQKHYEAIENWVKDINAPDKVDGAYPMYQNGSYDIPEALSDLYTQTDKDKMSDLLETLQESNHALDRLQESQRDLSMGLSDSTTAFEHTLDQQPDEQSKMDLLDNLHADLDKQGGIEAKLERFSERGKELEKSQEKPSAKEAAPKEHSSGGGLWSKFKNAVKSFFNGISSALSNLMSGTPDERTPQEKLTDLDNTLEELGFSSGKSKQKSAENTLSSSSEQNALVTQEEKRQAPDTRKKVGEVVGGDETTVLKPEEREEFKEAQQEILDKNTSIKDNPDDRRNPDLREQAGKVVGGDKNTVLEPEERKALKQAQVAVKNSDMQDAGTSNQTSKSHDADISAEKQAASKDQSLGG